MENYDIILSDSEYERLIEEIRQLKLDIAALTAEKDDLELHICREILADYNEKVGNLEYEALRKTLEIKQLKRTIEYIQAALNRQEQTTYEEAQQKTKEDYKQYEEDLKQKAEDIKKNAEYARKRAKQDEKNRQEARRKAEERAFEARKIYIRKEANKRIGIPDKENNEEEGYTDEEEEQEEKQGQREAEKEEEKKDETPDEELKRLYRKIVKKLHPDMNPDVTEAEKRLLQDAIEAYKDGNLERLREIAEEIDDEDIAEKFKDTPEDLEKLRELRDRLLLQKKDLEYQVQAIKEDFPYNMKDFLADEDAVRERQEAVRKFMQDCDEEIERLNKRIEELQEKLNK